MEEIIKDFDGRIGEGYYGEAPNGVHINVVAVVRGSATYAAAVRTLTSPSTGHVPFLACLGLGNVVRPATIIINKITIENEKYERLFYGAVQLGVAQGVMDAVKAGLIDKRSVGELTLLVACWLDPQAEEETTVRENARNAMFRAVQSALTPVLEDYVENQLKYYESATNNFYSGN